MHEQTTTRASGERATTAKTPTFRTREPEHDQARANWTEADWRFLRRLARREGWT